MNEGLPTAGTAMSLPVGTRMGEFELLGVVGEGGFSIVYLAYDHSLQRTVAIKEYLPGAIAFRDGAGTVRPRFEKYDATFGTGLQSFLNEARILAQFEHPALIRIHRFWEQNGTAYMVMQYCKGRTLRKVLQDEPERRSQEPWIKQQVIAPVLDALRLLHAQNYYHRDLSPDNIMVLDTGAPMLLDFGAARQVIGDMTQALTVILKPGFAPIEQYADDESMRQGPWTDIYGVGAVLYFVVTGKAPVASVARLVKDPLKRLHLSADYPISAPFAQAIDHALAVFPNHRPQSIDDFQEALNPTSGNLDALPAEPPLAGVSEVMDAVAADPPAQPGDALVGTDLRTSGAHAHADAAAGETLLGKDASKGNAGLPTTAAAPSPGVVGKPASMRSTRRWPWIVASVAGLLVVGAFVSWWTTQEGDPKTYADTGQATLKTDEAVQTDPYNSPQQALSVAPEMGSADGAGSAHGAMAAHASHLDEQVAPGAWADTQAIAVNRQPVAGVELRNHDVLPNPQEAADAERASSVKPVEIALSPSVPKVSEGTGAVALPVSANRTAETPNSQNAVVQLLNETMPNTAKGVPTHPAVDVERKTTTEAKQDKPGAYIKLSVRPWGRVIIDGQDKGISPPVVRIWLAEGEHHISIENGEFAKFSQSIKVSDKKDITISHKF
ncbi:serine/threonine protein kinase [Comamonas sp. MYb69]|uniref:serine/threonine protein kinase n=1 Tax=Comamonas sp. MYb69 TaxID=1848650 RepID=UPI00309F16B4